MDKKSIVEFVRVSILGRESQADDQKNIHFQRAAQAAAYAFDTLLSQIKLDEKGIAAIDAYYVKNYYNQPVKEALGYRYVGVSDSIVPVGEGKGIWYVQPSGGGKPFAKSRRPKTALFRSIGVGENINETFWSLRNLNTQRQIVFENIGDSALSDIREVDFGVVRGLDSYEDDEEVVVPDGRNDLLLQMCNVWFQKNKSDLTNNNS